MCGTTEIACIARGNCGGDTESESAVTVKSDSEESMNIEDTFFLHKFKFHIMERYGGMDVLLHAHLPWAVDCVNCKLWLRPLYTRTDPEHALKDRAKLLPFY